MEEVEDFQSLKVLDLGEGQEDGVIKSERWSMQDKEYEEGLW